MFVLLTIPGLDPIFLMSGLISMPHKDPTRNARMIKILPHRFLPEYDYAIWIDGNIKISADRHYINNLLKNCLGESGIALYRHPDRTCIYKEAEACIDLNKDDPQLIKEQMDTYRSGGYPINNGLVMSCVVIRDNKSPEIMKLSKDWWNELKNFSRRDQLAFNYITWKNNIKYGIIPGNAYGNKHFLRIRHKVKKSISSMDELIEYKNMEIEELRRELSFIKKSIFWKIAGSLIRFEKILFKIISNPFLMMKKAYKVIKREGIKMFFVYLFRKSKRFLNQE